jgi:hypothetical protein
LEGRVHRVTARRWLALVVAAALASVLLASPSAADDRGPEVNAGTDDHGASVHVIERSVSDGAGDTGHASRDGCARTYVATTGLFYKFPQARFDVPLGPAPSPFHQAFDVYCGSTYLATVWAIPQAAAAAIGAQLARELLARVEFPPARIATNPQRGLTGLPSWFWIDGTDGAPITLSRSEFGISVDLEVRLAGVSWDFGDGNHVDAGLGRAFPAASDVTHTFETRGRHTVRAAFRFTARYRVDGGAFTDLGPVPRTITQPYPVIEVRSLLVK